MKTTKEQNNLNGKINGEIWLQKNENQIIESDCLDIMKKIPDKSIDLILTDPPYGIGENKGQFKSRNKGRIDKRNGKPVIIKHPGYENMDWDNKIPKKIIFDEIFRISKNQIICGGNYFTEFLKPSSCWIVWDKVNGKSDFADCELIWTSFKSAVRLFPFMWSGMIQGKSIQEGKINQGNKKLCEPRIHPTQKPHQLFIWILNKYSEPDQLILDPFSGSGTTAIACHKLKRKFICIEKEPKYVELSRKRLQVEQSQMELF